jgi:hypothetical protein
MFTKSTKATNKKKIKKQSGEKRWLFEEIINYGNFAGIIISF